MFKDYALHGWVLVPIKKGEKSPRGRGWNMRDLCVTNPLVAGKLHSAGLAHAYSGTCAIDIDNLRVAREALAEIGVDIDRLFNAPSTVRIDSGRPGHAKLLFSLPDPLPSVVFAKDEMGKHAVQFRCATKAGLTTQDVLPPSIHPDTGLPYEWGFGDPIHGDWKRLPALPVEIAEWWVSNSFTRENAEVPQAVAAPEEMRALVMQQDPDCGYNEWLRVGMALHHESGGAPWGLQLWNAWSSGGAKYKGLKDLDTRWVGFGSSPNPVTAGVLRQERVSSPDEFSVLACDASDDDFDGDPWEAAKPKFELVHASDWAKRPPPTWIIKGVLPKQDLGMVYGPPSCGKSFFVLDMAVAISSGKKWRNIAETRHGPVVWIAAEAAGSMRNRLHAHAVSTGDKLSDLDLWIIGDTPNLTDAVQSKALVDSVAEKQPLLIVVDTLSAASGGANENSGEDMGAVLDACRALHNDTGALVLIIHHSGKDQSRGARGWSGLRAAMNVEFEVRSFVDSKARMAVITKQRDGEDGVEMPFQLVPVQISMEDTSCVVEHFSSVTLAAKVAMEDPGVERIKEEDAYCAIVQYYEGEDPDIKPLDATEFGDLM